MDEQTVEQITESTKRMAEAAEALQQTLMHDFAQQQEESAPRWRRSWRRSRRTTKFERSTGRSPVRSDRRYR